MTSSSKNFRIFKKLTCLFMLISNNKLIVTNANNNLCKLLLKINACRMFVDKKNK